MSNVVRGPWGSPKVVLDGSFQELSKLWLVAKAWEFRAGWQRECERLLKREVWPKLGRHNAELVTRKEISEVLEGLPPGIAQNVHAVMSCVLRWAVETGRLDANPLNGLRRRRVKARDRVLSMEELLAIWQETAGDHAFDRIVRLLLLTGQRRDEWGHAVWSEVRGDVLELPGKRTKNGRAHRVPLAKLAKECLPKQRPGNPWLFGRRRSAGFSGWSRCKARLDLRCGVTGWTLHDLRRSFCDALC